MKRYIYYSPLLDELREYSCRRERKGFFYLLGIRADCFKLYYIGEL